MTQVQMQDKIKAILLASDGFENNVNAIQGITIDSLSKVIDRLITLGVAQMSKYEPTTFYQSVLRELSKDVKGDTKTLLNTLAIQVNRILRNGKTVESYSDIQRIIEDNYDKLSTEFDTTIEQRKDDDLSDLLDVEANEAGKPRDGLSEFVPDVDQSFRKWGNYGLLRDVINTNSFMPVLISGLSGNGKSVNVEQVCAELGREYVRLQITPETDEGDLLGNMTLVDGNTVFQKGPVIRAMERGAILCIDEIDRGSNRLMALQGVMEGKPVLLKKTGEIVRPAEGFNVVATANTKGQGDDTGKFAAATILDEAFLERFVMVIEQQFAPMDIELRILAAHMVKFGATVSRSVLKDLTKWANITRENYASGKIDEYISTRRLTHILQIFSVTDDIKKSVELGVSRYDQDTKESLIKSFELLI